MIGKGGRGVKAEEEEESGGGGGKREMMMKKSQCIFLDFLRE